MLWLGHYDTRLSFFRICSLLTIALFFFFMKILFNFMIHFLVYNKKSRITKFLLSVVVPIPPLCLCLSWNWCVNKVKLKQLSLIWRSGLGVLELDIWNCSFCYGTGISRELLVLDNAYLPATAKLLYNLLLCLYFLLFMKF